MVDQAEDGKNNILISLRKIESEVMDLTRGSEYYPRNVMHKESNAKSVLLTKKKEISLISCATNTHSDNNQKHGNAHNWPISLKQPIQVEFTTVIVPNLIKICAPSTHGQMDTGKWIIHIRFCERSSRVENGLVRWFP